MSRWFATNVEISGKKLIVNKQNIPVFFKNIEKKLIHLKYREN